MSKTVVNISFRLDVKEYVSLGKDFALLLKDKNKEDCVLLERESVNLNIENIEDELSIQLVEKDNKINDLSEPKIINFSFLKNQKEKEFTLKLKVLEKKDRKSSNYAVVICYLLIKKIIK